MNRQAGWLRHPATPYVAPFAVFMLLLAAGPHLPTGAWDHPLRVVILTAVILFFSWHVVDLRARHWAGSLALGIAVFVVWIGPDAIWPGYRNHWLFQNSITGALGSSLPDESRSNLMVLIFRTVRAVILVPIIEELFWRGWLMRWLIRTDFIKAPLGSYTAMSFWATALLFASEHGPYWEVGLLAGIAYNWWVIRTKSLADCILAHAVTNLVLSAYVIVAGKWEYWM